jgi:hypothetical protein
MMLVEEDGDRLWLGRALPSHWLAGETVTEVKDAPTAFGPVSFVIHPHPRQGRADVELWAPVRRTLKTILLRLRDPGMRTIADVKVNGEAIRTFSGDTIELRSPTEHLDIEVTYR